MSVHERLAQLGIEVPAPMTPAGHYVPAVRSGALLFLSGAGPVRAAGPLIPGKVGGGVGLDLALEAARVTGLQLLAAIGGELGSLDRVRRGVKTFGMVNCAPGFN